MTCDIVAILILYSSSAGGLEAHVRTDCLPGEYEVQVFIDADDNILTGYGLGWEHVWRFVDGDRDVMRSTELGPVNGWGDIVGCGESDEWTTDTTWVGFMAFEADYLPVRTYVEIYVDGKAVDGEFEYAHEQSFPVRECVQQPPDCDTDLEDVAGWQLVGELGDVSCMTGPR